MRKFTSEEKAKIMKYYGLVGTTGDPKLSIGLFLESEALQKAACEMNCIEWKSPEDILKAPFEADPPMDDSGLIVD